MTRSVTSIFEKNIKTLNISSKVKKYFSIEIKILIFSYPDREFFILDSADVFCIFLLD